MGNTFLAHATDFLFWFKRFYDFSSSVPIATLTHSFRFTDRPMTSVRVGPRVSRALVFHLQ
jgi:hypothetical protein